eukprot:6178427-Pleurochrysis_carterae.AAC.3
MWRNVRFKTCSGRLFSTTRSHHRIPKVCAKRQHPTLPADHHRPHTLAGHVAKSPPRYVPSVGLGAERGERGIVALLCSHTLDRSTRLGTSTRVAHSHSSSRAAIPCRVSAGTSRRTHARAELQPSC